KHMKIRSKTVPAFILAFVVAAAAAGAQPAPTPTTPYGTPIGLESAKKVMAAAEAGGTKNNWGMAIVILDSTGHIVMHGLDNTLYGSIAVAEDKACSALDYRRPTKVFEDLVAQGASVCARSPYAERRLWRVSYPSPWMARLSGRSAY